MFGCFGFTLGPASADPLTFISVTPLPQISGASAIEVDPGGLRGIVLSDRGRVFGLKIARKDGGIASVDAEKLPSSFRREDLEGLAIGAGGSFVSVEKPSRVFSLAKKIQLPAHPDFARFSSNQGLEALAIDETGRLIAISEGLAETGGTYAIYVYENGRWDVLRRFPRRWIFRPVGADVGPDGMLYLLERGFGPLGFRSRISRLPLTPDNTRPELLLTTATGQYDNLEGLSVWTSRSGAVCLTMVSDDNFRAVQRSEIVEYALTETLAPGRSCN